MRKWVSGSAFLSLLAVSVLILANSQEFLLCFTAPTWPTFPAWAPRVVGLPSGEMSKLGPGDHCGGSSRDLETEIGTRIDDVIQGPALRVCESCLGNRDVAQVLSQLRFLYAPSENTNSHITSKAASSRLVTMFHAACVSYIENRGDTDHKESWSQ